MILKEVPISYKSFLNFTILGMVFFTKTLPNGLEAGRWGGWEPFIKGSPSVPSHKRVLFQRPDVPSQLPQSHPIFVTSLSHRRDLPSIPFTGPTCCIDVTHYVPHAETVSPYPQFNREVHYLK